ncbi:hypothetical protein AB6811_05225 [Tenuifilum sp. 4138str]
MYYILLILLFSITNYYSVTNLYFEKKSLNIYYSNISKVSLRFDILLEVWSEKFLKKDHSDYHNALSTLKKLTNYNAYLKTFKIDLNLKKTVVKLFFNKFEKLDIIAEYWKTYDKKQSGQIYFLLINFFNNNMYYEISINDEYLIEIQKVNAMCTYYSKDYRETHYYIGKGDAFNENSDFDTYKQSMIIVKGCGFKKLFIDTIILNQMKYILLDLTLNIRNRLIQRLVF